MKIRDERLSPSPAIFRKGDGLTLCVRVLTPLRLTLVQEFVFHPLIRIWKLILLLFILDCLLFYFRIYTIFPDLPFTRQEFLIGMAIPMGICLIERFLRYPLTRLVAGRTISVRLSDEAVKIKTGLFYRTYRRSQRMSFAQVPFEQSITAPYAHARLLVLIIGDTRRVKIAEIFDTIHIGKIVNNLNVALTLHARQQECDENPMRARLARATH